MYNKKPVSKYAATYTDQLNQATKTADPDKFINAVAEQMGEAFVGYMLGILPNDNGYVDFRKGHLEEYKLMDKICKAKVLATD